MKRIKIIDYEKIANKRVLLRIDLNVPIRNSRILDDYKLVRIAPTIKKLANAGAKIIIMSHLGRPEPGKNNEQFSLKPVAHELSGICGHNIRYINDIRGFTAITAAAKLKPGQAIMLENLRFEKQEKKNSRVFAKKLAKIGEIYINDAFAVSHRADASLAAIKDYLPAYAGPLLADEVKNLEKAISKNRQLVVIIGGAKLETKIPIIKNFKNKAAHILIGGAVANNFFAAKGYNVGRSLINKAGIESARKIKQKNLVFPVDVIVGSKKTKWTAKMSKLGEVEENEYIFDIGPKTVKLFGSIIKQADTIIWNGPMGYFEKKQFRFGTLAIARLAASRSKGRAFGLVGGGETVEALYLSKMQGGIDWISTGGGAMLDYLGGKKMPGLNKIVSGF